MTASPEARSTRFRDLYLSQIGISPGKGRGLLHGLLSQDPRSRV
jgi:hypothetical protein